MELGLIIGGSPWYIPRSDEAFNIPRPTSMKEGTNSMWDAMKGNTPSGVVDYRFL